jgi:hypothetical protein
MPTAAAARTRPALAAARIAAVLEPARARPAMARISSRTTMPVPPATIAAADDHDIRIVSGAVAIIPAVTIVIGAARVIAAIRRAVIPVRRHHAAGQRRQQRTADQNPAERPEP